MKRHLPFILLLFILAIGSCTNDQESPSSPDEIPYRLDSNQGVLGARVDLSQAGTIFPLLQSSLSSSRIQTVDFKLELLSEVKPPQLNGQSLRAANVRISGDLLVISYNFEGSTYLGGMDIVNISQPNSPRLITQVLFEDGSVSDAYIEGGHLYFAGALDIDQISGLNSPAIVGKIRLNEASEATDAYTQVDLPSFVGTYTERGFGRYFATSGNSGGGLTIMDENFQRTGFIDLPNARSVAVGDTTAAVLQGEPGRIAVLDENLALINQFSIAGASNPEAKGQVNYFNSYLAVAGGLEGVLIYNPVEGKLITTLKMSPIEGVADPDIVANGLVSEGNSLFMANGAAGLYVADLIGNELEILGTFNVNASANGVAVREDLVVIANGTAGTRILNLTKSKPIQEGEIFNIDFSTTSRDELAVKGWVFQSFTQSGSELRGGRYGGPDRTNLLNPSASQKNQIKIPASQLIAVDELNVSIRRDQPYEVYVWFQKKDGSIENLGLTRLADNNSVQNLSFDLKGTENLDYVILGAAPAAGGYGRVFVSKVSMSGKF
ncbi:hypothetical protein [Algoriphagus confluentis]|uniref:DUF5689 domain-containing protein n=1 Tax=Algoriphagus confluentis TaxID=1697556 RepID=A0ABQ6PRV7_9BACT|nr:hypothetical protein Aconfl_31110 [Algoriphagus confluentis]